MEDYDLAVIGGGPGGYTAAAHAAENGLGTVLVEAGELGGTCLNRGCIPAKAMLHAAETLRAIQKGGSIGVHAEGVSFDYREMLAYRQGTVEKLRRGVGDMLHAAGVTVIRGKGQVLSPGRIRVLAPGGEEVLTARDILLAAGSRPGKLPVPGMDLPGVLDSDGLFALEELPESLVVIGGGVIGVEMAEALSAMGTEVTLVEAQPRLLPGMDREAAQGLRMVLRGRGVKLHTGAALQRVTREGDMLRCVFSEGSREMTADGQYVLCAVGRRPDTDGLFADGLRPRMTASGHLEVDRDFQTSLPGVYAVGDLVPGAQLAHAAGAQGRAAAGHFTGQAWPADLGLVPRCVYTSPEIAEAGLTEKEAVGHGIAVRTGKALMGANGRTQVSGGERGFIRVVAHAETGVLLGASLMCERATDLIGEFTVAIANRLTVGQMLRAVRPHPTFEEAVGEALEALV